MRNLVALAVLLVTTLYGSQVHTQDYIDYGENSRESDVENIWSLSRRSLKIDSAELKEGGGKSTSASNENTDYETFYSKISSRPAIQRFARYHSQSPTFEEKQQQRQSFMHFGDDAELADYDFDADNNDDDNDNIEQDDKYRHGGKDKKKKKKKKKGNVEDSEEEKKKAKVIKKFVPQFWYGKHKPGPAGGSHHVEQVGWIINNDANPGGWKVWPQHWDTPTGVSNNGLRWVDGKGWVGTVGAPWKMAPAQMDWGPGYELPEDDGGGKKGKKKKNKGNKKKNKKKKKKNKKKKKRGQQDPCSPDGGGGGKKGRSLFREGRGKDKKKKKKKGGGGMGMMGWGVDPCDKGPKPWFGWPQKIKFIPPPPRGSQIFLNHASPKPLKSGWSDYHGWNWKNKITSGWGVSDLIGVVHL